MQFFDLLTPLITSGITMLWLKEMGTVLVVPVGDGEYFLLSAMAGRDVVLNFTVGLREEIIRESKSQFYKTQNNNTLIN